MVYAFLICVINFSPLSTPLENAIIRGPLMRLTCLSKFQATRTYVRIGEPYKGPLTIACPNYNQYGQTIALGLNLTSKGLLFLHNFLCNSSSSSFSLPRISSYYKMLYSETKRPKQKNLKRIQKVFYLLLKFYKYLGCPPVWAKGAE